MNITVIGIGGTGGFFGGKLAQLLKSESDLNIHFIARGEHLAEIRKNGLLLDADEGTFTCVPTTATDDISAIPVPDLCLVCVKSYDLENVMKQLKNRLHERTMILPLLNGVDIYERIRTVIKNGIVFPSCVYIGTHIEKPGKVMQRGGACTIHFGKDPYNDYVDQRIFDLFNKAAIKYSWMDNPYTEIWSKFTFIAPFGLVGANYSRTLGEIRESEELSGLVKGIMKEVAEIAAKKGIYLPPEIISESYAKGGKFPFETKTSFQRDVENMDKPDERDLFGGSIIRMGRELGVQTPVTEKIYESINRMKSLR